METAQNVFNFIIFVLIIGALAWAYNEEKNR